MTSIIIDQNFKLTTERSLKLLSALKDMENVSIIQCTMTHTPKSIENIIEQTKIPSVTCYRKVNKLVKNKILVIDGFKKLPNDFRKIKLYKCISTKLDLSFGKNELTVIGKKEETEFN